jgi:nucleotide-binding universal stress UspA family protein
MKAVVPLDGGDTAMGIMPTVRRLIDMSPGIEIHFVRVVDPKDVRGRLEHIVGEPPAVTMGKATVQAPPPRLVESHGEAMTRKGTELREQLEAIAAMEIPQAASAVHVKWSGNAAQAITELANELDADVIVMATHGRSGLSHVLAGSVAEAVIKTSGRPVLVQKPA